MFLCLSLLQLASDRSAGVFGVAGYRGAANCSALGGIHDGPVGEPIRLSGGRGGRRAEASIVGRKPARRRWLVVVGARARARVEVHGDLVPLAIGVYHRASPLKCCCPTNGLISFIRH